ncbi:sensor histidine kinase [Micromonosporaceae bacterium Da 78-11]
MAKLSRSALPAAAMFVLLALVAGVADLVNAAEPIVVGLPFAVVAVASVLLAPLRRTVERLTHYREVTPYSALADAAQRLRSPSLEEALTGLARALADGTGARRAVVWLAVGERLVATASYPATELDAPDSAENLAVLLARPGIGHVVPVLEATELRAVLSVEKPELPVTPGDRVLMQDVATGAALLLRTVALNAVLSERVRRADRLAEELRASRHRLAQAREVERRRLLTELSRATSGRLVALRVHVAAARADLVDQGERARSAGAALVLARTEVDELLDRFRVIARGVYPAVLRSQGPGAALEELIADLRRPVRLTGDLDVRVAWEIESAVYQVTAATLDVLAAQPGVGEVEVRLTRADGRMRVLIEDPSPPVPAEQVRAALVDDIERLAALGGDLGCNQADGSGLRLVAWLPDRLDALLDVDQAAEPVA